MNPPDKFKKAALLPRILSAVVAVFLLGLVYKFFSDFGVQIFVGLAILLMIREFSRMTFQPAPLPKFLPIWFGLVSILATVIVLTREEPFASLSLLFAFYLAGSILFTRERVSNERLLPIMTLSFLGIFLCALMPTADILMLRLPNGFKWFAFHLLVVFCGDIFAYFGGILFGKTPLMPSLSPKKTVAGAVAGLVGSALVGAVFSFFVFPMIPLWFVAAFCCAGAFTAQMGDLLISLIKRMAQVKDSGRFMPGHGGILDRADGIILSAPLFYSFALFVETHL